MKTIIAALLVLLAGCKSAPTKSYFLHTTTDGSSLMWVEWTTVGDRIEGDWVFEVLSDGKIENHRLSFIAEIEGENVRITWKDPGKYPPTHWATLKGDTFSLDDSLVFKRVTRAECFAASRKLADRAAAIRAKATPSQ